VNDPNMTIPTSVDHPNHFTDCQGRGVRIGHLLLPENIAQVDCGENRATSISGEVGYLIVLETAPRAGAQP